MPPRQSRRRPAAACPPAVMLGRAHSCLLSHSMQLHATLEAGQADSDNGRRAPCCQVEQAKACQAGNLVGASSGSTLAPCRHACSAQRCHAWQGLQLGARPAGLSCLQAGLLMSAVRHSVMLCLGRAGAGCKALSTSLEGASTANSSPVSSGCSGLCSARPHRSAGPLGRCWAQDGWRWPWPAGSAAGMQTQQSCIWIVRPLGESQTLDIGGLAHAPKSRQDRCSSDAPACRGHFRLARATRGLPDHTPNFTRTPTLKIPQRLRSSGHGIGLVEQTMRCAVCSASRCQIAAALAPMASQVHQGSQPGPWRASYQPMWQAPLRLAALRHGNMRSALDGVPFELV